MSWEAACSNPDCGWKGTVLRRWGLDICPLCHGRLLVADGIVPPPSTIFPEFFKPGRPSATEIGVMTMKETAKKRLRVPTGLRKVWVIVEHSTSHGADLFVEIETEEGKSVRIERQTHPEHEKLDRIGPFWWEPAPSFTAEYEFPAGAPKKPEEHEVLAECPGCGMEWPNHQYPDVSVSLAKLSKDLERRCNWLDSQTRDLHEFQNKLVRQFRDLQDTFKRLQDRVKRLDAGMGEAGEVCEELKQARESHYRRLNDQNTRIEKLAERVKTLELQYLARAPGAARLHTEYAKLHAEILTAKNQIDNIQTAYEAHIGPQSTAHPAGPPVTLDHVERLKKEVERRLRHVEVWRENIKGIT